jgi:hypothetical protein
MSWLKNSGVRPPKYGIYLHVHTFQWPGDNHDRDSMGFACGLTVTVKVTGENCNVWRSRSSIRRCTTLDGEYMKLR